MKTHLTNHSSDNFRKKDLLSKEETDPLNLRVKPNARHVLEEI